MAKDFYKIPADLNASYADMEIRIGSSASGGTPIPVKVILMFTGSVLLSFWVLSYTFVEYGSTFQKIMFMILWLGLTLLLVKFDKTKRINFQLLGTLVNYLPRSSRHLITRTSSDASDFYLLAGIKTINETTGMVTYIDGTYGYWYRVVGSASVLLFDADRVAILNRVDSFFRKCETDHECIFITTKESQRIHRQVVNLKRTYDNLEIHDPDLDDLVDEQFNTLKHYVGHSFKSIHQYMVIKADNEEALLRAKNVLQSEVENSSRMVKQCALLRTNEINDVLKVIYKGDGKRGR